MRQRGRPPIQYYDETTLTPLIKRAARTMNRAEARVIASRFFQAKRMRINFQRHITMVAKGGQEHVTLDWAFQAWKKMERDLSGLLVAYAKEHPAFEWLKMQLCSHHMAGIIIAYVDPEHWGLHGTMLRAGYNPWQRFKGPLSTAIKTIRKRHLLMKWEPYYEIYRTRKQKLVDRAAEGKTIKRTQQVAALMKADSTWLDHSSGLCRRGEPNRNGYECGLFTYLPPEVVTLPPHLPLSNLHMRAYRYTGRVFVSHLYEALSFIELGRRYLPSRAIGSQDYVPPPRMEMLPGMAETPLEVRPEDLSSYNRRRAIFTNRAGEIEERL